jgi:membrane protein
MSLGVIIVVPPILEYVGLDEETHWLLSLARWPALLLVVVTANAIVYRYGPSREKARWVWLSWGSVAAAVLWLVLSAGFSFYASNFAKFNETYGSMGAVIAVMTWIWLSAIIVIAGAELNAELEHQTAQDTTTGRERPLGVRGARMADTVGPSAEKTRRDPEAADKPSDFPDAKKRPGRPKTERSGDSRSRVADVVGRFLISAIREKIRSPSRPPRAR